MVRRILQFLLPVMAFLGSVRGAELEVGGWRLNNIHGPSQVGIVDSVAVDLNKDGLMDVISVSIEDGHLRGYINQGNLEFTEQYISTDVLGAFRLSSTDINSDGNIDFLVPSIETHEIIVLIADTNTKPFGYRKQVLVKSVLLPTDAQAADLNSDGLMDVVSVSFEENLLLLHIQNSQGEFDTIPISKTPLSPRKLVVEDFNNDQKPDILLASSGDDSIRLFSNLNGITYEEIVISDQAAGVRYIAKCDHPETDYPNFVAGVPGSNQIWHFYNKENNKFESDIIDSDLPGANSLFCLDIGDDKVIDLIAVSSTLSNIYTYALNGFNTKKLIANSRDGYVNVEAAVFEANTPPLILTQAFLENRNLFYSPTISNLETVVWENFPDGAYAIEKADLDNDGDEDLVYAAFREDKIYWAEKIIDGYIIHVIYDGVDGPQGIAVADTDSDGDLDVISAGAWDDTFWLHENLSKNQFNTSAIFTHANNAARISFADFNNDGLLDLVGTSSLDDSVWLFKRVGSSYKTIQLDDHADGALALVAKDYDSDNDVDLVVGNYFGNSIVAYNNEGDYKFDKILISKDKIKPTSVLLADMVGDIETDLVYNSLVMGSAWLVENKAGVFDEELLISDQIPNIQDMGIVNLNNDSLPDLVTTSSSASSLNGFVNQSSSAFIPKNLFSNTFGARSLLVMEPGVDGLPVLATASNADNSIRILTSIDLIYSNGFE